VDDIKKIKVGIVGTGFSALSQIEALKKIPHGLNMITTKKRMRKPSFSGVTLHMK
jgi:hypothetical protein